MEIKQLLKKGILLVVFAFAAYSFVWSDIGLLKYLKEKKQLELAELALNDLKTNIDRLTRRITKFESDMFYVQRIAREDLQMGYPDETVYIVK